MTDAILALSLKTILRFFIKSLYCQKSANKIKYYHKLRAAILHEAVKVYCVGPPMVRVTEDSVSHIEKTATRSSSQWCSDHSTTSHILLDLQATICTTVQSITRQPISVFQNVLPWQFSVEFLENGLSNDHQIRDGTMGLTYFPVMMSLNASDQQQNAIKYCTQVRKNGPGGQIV